MNGGDPVTFPTTRTSAGSNPAGTVTRSPSAPLKISDSVLFVVEGVLMIVLIALTLLAQILFRRSFLRAYILLSYRIMMVLISV